jgi:nitronate monooxygenase
MKPPLTELGLSLPVLAAPMAGGPSTPALVVAAARAGGLGLLAGGYKTAPALAEQIAAVRSAAVPFGVNLFAPNPIPVEIGAFRRYAEALQGEARRYGVQLQEGDPIEDDDDWAAKIDLLRADPVPLLSFTFGVPSRATVASLRQAGTLVLQTVTSLEEAQLAVEAGVDLLAVQSAAAGGHSGTLTPERLPPPVPLAELVARIRDSVRLPLVAAGGLATSAEIAAVLRAGADVAMVGTLLLRTDESGASAAHRTALAGPDRRETVITRAFTGRPARGLRNRFIDTYDSWAPAGYPAVHHLTSPLRKAAAAAGDAEWINLWAGTGYRQARAEPVQQVLAGLSAGL